MDNDSTLRLITYVFLATFEISVELIRSFNEWDVPMEVFHMLGHLPDSCSYGYLPRKSVGIDSSRALMAMSVKLLSFVCKQHYVTDVSLATSPVGSSFTLPFQVVVKMVWKSFLFYCFKSMYVQGYRWNKFGILTDLRPLFATVKNIFKNGILVMSLPEIIMRLERDCPELIGNILILYTVSDILELNHASGHEVLLPYLRRVLFIIKEFDMLLHIKIHNNEKVSKSLFTDEEVAYLSTALNAVTVDCINPSNNNNNISNSPMSLKMIDMKKSYDIYERDGIHMCFWNDF